MKKYQYSVKYETGLDELIVWYHGPFFHNNHDLTIYKSALKNELEEQGGEKKDTLVILLVPHLSRNTKEENLPLNNLRFKSNHKHHLPLLNKDIT